jgi:hypothetical protein
MCAVVVIAVQTRCTKLAHKLRRSAAEQGGGTSKKMLPQ